MCHVHVACGCGNGHRISTGWYHQDSDFSADRFVPKRPKFMTPSPAMALKNSLYDTTGIIGVLHPGSEYDQYAPRILDTHSIDYAVLRDWNRECIEYHSTACNSKRISCLPGFRVLDCRSRRVIDARIQCPHVALSYVWGQPQQETIPGLSLPLTIEDAMIVTLALGLDYLRKCLPTRFLSILLSTAFET
jgi:hypothetical protein